MITTMIDTLIEENFKLRLRVQELEQAIESHKKNTGNNLCWENDIELWATLGEAEYPHDTMLDEKTFLKNCKKYYDSRLMEVFKDEPSATAEDDEEIYNPYYNGRW